MTMIEARGADYDFNRDAVHASRLEDSLLRSKKRFRCARCGDDLHITRFERVGDPLAQPIKYNFVSFHRTTCDGCRVNSLKELRDHPKFTREAERFLIGVAGGMRAGARSRGIPCLIDADDLMEMYLRQDGACAVSGIPFKLESGTGARDKRGWFKPSVDRIDSRGSYSVANVHLVAQAVNLMKFDLPMTLFLDLCERITERRFSGNI